MDVREMDAVSWICLVAAGLLEVVWAYAMKQSEGFSRPWPSIITLVAMIASFPCCRRRCGRCRSAPPT